MDIVQRLRCVLKGNKDAQDAADEITRLRDVISAILDDHEDGRGYTHLDDELAAMAMNVLPPNAPAQRTAEGRSGAATGSASGNNGE